jgi:hypothetical protein
MTSYTNAIIFGFPYSAANIDKMKRAGCAFYMEGLTGAQRLAILNGTAPIPNSPEAGNFQTVFSTSNPPSTRDWLIGCAQMNPAHWARLQAFIGTLPAGLRYLRASIDANGRTFTILETNVPALQDEIGRRFGRPIGLLQKMGLRPYRAGI